MTNRSNDWIRSRIGEAARGVVRLVDGDPGTGHAGNDGGAGSPVSSGATRQVEQLESDLQVLRKDLEEQLGLLTRAVESLRARLLTVADADLAHQHQLVQIDDRLSRVGSVDDLRQLSAHWLRQKGIVKVSVPDDPAHWRIEGGTWEGRDSMVVARPAFLGPGADDVRTVLQFGVLMPTGPDEATSPIDAGGSDPEQPTQPESSSS